LKKGKKTDQPSPKELRIVLFGGRRKKRNRIKAKESFSPYIVTKKEGVTSMKGRKKAAGAVPVKTQPFQSTNHALHGKSGEEKVNVLREGEGSLNRH